MHAVKAPEIGSTRQRSSNSSFVSSLLEVAEAGDRTVDYIV